MVLLLFASILATAGLFSLCPMDYKRAIVSTSRCVLLATLETDTERSNRPEWGLKSGTNKKTNKVLPDRKKEGNSSAERMEIIFGMMAEGGIHRIVANQNPNATLHVYLFLTQREEEEGGIRGKTDTVKKERTSSPYAPKVQSGCLRRRI